MATEHLNIPIPGVGIWVGADQEIPILIRNLSQIIQNQWFLIFWPYYTSKRLPFIDGLPIKNGDFPWQTVK